VLVREPPFNLAIHLEFAFIRVYSRFLGGLWLLLRRPAAFESGEFDFAELPGRFWSHPRQFFLIRETAANPDFEPIRKRSAFRQVDGADTDVSVSLDFAN
jgi:hypothetical protein